MTKRKSYWELLRDPRWQRRRLEVLNSAGWECTSCGAKTEELQVHHRLYRKGKDPWEYEDEALLCLCSGCHEAEEGAVLVMNEMVMLLGRCGLGRPFITGVCTAVLSVFREGHAITALTEEEAQGVAVVYGLTSNQVIGALSGKRTTKAALIGLGGKIPVDWSRVTG